MPVLQPFAAGTSAAVASCVAVRVTHTPVVAWGGLTQDVPGPQQRLAPHGVMPVLQPFAAGTSATVACLVPAAVTARDAVEFSVLHPVVRMPIESNETRIARRMNDS